MNEVSESENFYHDRIKNFDQERQKITDYANLIKPNQRELHILQWEGRQQDETATMLNNELTGCDQDLRKIMYKTEEAKLELQNLSLKHLEKKSQIQRLSELSQPVQRDVTYLYDDKISYSAPVGGKQG
jgi:uncharacterized coiled-coil DUF342 family protein